MKRFLPFLSGSRSCIGMSLAQLNYTTAVASLLSRFSFRLAEDVSPFLMFSSPLHHPDAQKALESWALLMFLDNADAYHKTVFTGNIHGVVCLFHDVSY